MAIVNVFHYWFKLIKLSNILNNDAIFIVMAIVRLCTKINSNREPRNYTIQGISHSEWKLLFMIFKVTFIRFVLKNEWISHLFLIIPKQDSLNYLEWESLCYECHVTNWMKNVECDMLWEKSERCAGMNISLNWYYWIALVFELRQDYSNWRTYRDFWELKK